MSQFEPQGYIGKETGLKGLTNEPLSDADLSLINRVFQDPRRIPPVFWAYLTSYVEANPPLLPISQVFGFSSFTVRDPAAVGFGGAVETTTSTAYTTLATAGPSYTEVGPGQYVLFIYFRGYNSSASGTNLMSVSVNGGGVTDFGAAALGGVAQGTGFGILTLALTAASNSIVSQYRVTAGTGSWEDRQIVLMKSKNV